MQKRPDGDGGHAAALARFALRKTATEPALDKITALLRTILDVPATALFVRAEGRWWLKSHSGPPDAASLADSLSPWLAEVAAGEPLVVADRLDPPLAGHPPPRSALILPLISPTGETIGALCAVDHQPRHFAPARIDLAATFAMLAVDALELRLMAQTDFLTGTLTRRALVSALEGAHAAFHRNGAEAALLLLDIDHFKRINDSLGHSAGDGVLAHVAQALVAPMPEAAQLGRLGGEEFGILLPGVDAGAAMAIAQSLRATIARLVVGPQQGAGVTASFGVAPLLASYPSVFAWLDAADEALYRAKTAGRNRCVFAGL